MKRSLALTTVAVLVLSGLLWVADAWARVPSGGSSGSRGSRSFSAPVSPSTTSPSRSMVPPAAAPLQSTPQRSPWGGIGGMVGGLLVGGLIGSLLFGGMGHGGFGGGIGMMEIVILAGLAFLAFKFMRSRQQPQPAAPPGYAAPGGYGTPAWRPENTSASYGATATPSLEAPAAPNDLERGIGHIRQMDAGFDPARFADAATDIFFKVQAAWTARDMARAATLLTPEMQDTLKKDCDRLRADRRINRLENIAVRQAAVTEAWQERGQDFVTVYFLASLLDYTTDEGGAQVLDGNATVPVKFEEYWTFVRPVGPNPWQLSAIQQPA